MNKEEFLSRAIKLLQRFIEEDGSSLRAQDYLQQQGVPKVEVDDVLFIISCMSKDCI